MYDTRVNNLNHFKCLSPKIQNVSVNLICNVTILIKHIFLVFWTINTNYHKLLSKAKIKISKWGFYFSTSILIFTHFYKIHFSCFVIVILKIIPKFIYKICTNDLHFK